MILPIVAFGDPVLKKQCKELPRDYGNLDELLSNMYETMYGAFGVGLVLKVVNSGGNGRVEPIAFNDPDSIPRVGVSMNAPAGAGSDCVVCTGPTFDCVIQNRYNTCLVIRDV